MTQVLNLEAPVGSGEAHDPLEGPTYGRHSTVDLTLTDVKSLLPELYVGRHFIESLVSRGLFPVYVRDLQVKSQR